jgi:hypothetical protein
MRDMDEGTCQVYFDAHANAACTHKACRTFQDILRVTASENVATDSRHVEPTAVDL